MSTNSTKPETKRISLKKYILYSFTISGPNTTENQQIPPLYECQYGGRTYKEGQVMYPEDAPCKMCVCQNGFNGKHDYWVEIIKPTFLMQTSSPTDLV
jgi:hypothetical protein